VLAVADLLAAYIEHGTRAADFDRHVDEALATAAAGITAPLDEPFVRGPDGDWPALVDDSGDTGKPCLPIPCPSDDTQT
jgi:hypothetical protein